MGLDYGDFPFSRDTSAEYFFAVVASGHEGSGFLEGAVGNLSDAVASSWTATGGSGDTLAAPHYHRVRRPGREALSGVIGVA